MSPTLRWLVVIYLALGAMCSGCAHRYHRTETAHREETTRSTWEEHAETAVEQKRSEETKSSVKRVRERFRPDGTLLERLTEQVASDGRVQVDMSASASLSAARTDFSDVKAGSNSTTDARTTAGLPWWLWLVGAAALVVGAWVLRRRIRSVIPW